MRARRAARLVLARREPSTHLLAAEVQRRLRVRDDEPGERGEGGDTAVQHEPVREAQTR